MTLGREIFQLGYQISPIILTNGIASEIPGQMMPIVALTEAANFTLGLLSGEGLPSLDQFFAHFRVLPGTTLIKNQIGNYPFANQQVAANAMIAQPLNIAVMMSCPARGRGGYVSKLATITALKKALALHINSGGTFTIATPSYIYTDCVMTGMRDVSSGSSRQVQTDWQLDFEQPLVTLDQAQQVYNSLMQKISSGLPTGTTPSWSGLASTVGSNLTTAAGNVSNSVSNLVGSVASGVSSAVSSASSVLSQ
jgi:hypothetical protein